MNEWVLCPNKYVRLCESVNFRSIVVFVLVLQNMLNIICNLLDGIISHTITYLYAYKLFGINHLMFLKFGLRFKISMYVLRKR